MNHFCEMLPKNLKQLFLNHIFITSSETNIVLCNHLDQIKEYINDMTPALYKPDDVIIEEG